MDRNRYEVLDVIGSGGMATVWRARDNRLGRLVAIKRPTPAFDDSVSARFAREARAAATVAHPNVVAIYDTGVDDTGPYLVMELVDGPSLAAADVAADRVARIGLEVASALAALHAAGVVHGDVKPGNILVGRDGAKLTDFGIARAADDTLTLRTGVAFGTPAYAAPETLAHGERSAAADVYTLASTLHELLTGARWSAASGATQAMPPGDWSRVLSPALSAEPAYRPTAAAFAASLATLDGNADRSVATTPMHLPAAATVRSPARASTTDGISRDRRIAAGVSAAGAALILVVLVVALALRDGDGLANGELEQSTVASVASAGPTPPTVPDRSTSATTPAPTAPTTIPSTTIPSTAAQAASGAGRTTTEVAADLVDLIERVPPNELKPKDARDILKRVDDVLRVAAREPSEIERTLRSAAERIGRKLRDDAVSAPAETLLIELAGTLGLPASTVTEAYGGDG